MEGAAVGGKVTFLDGLKEGFLEDGAAVEGCAVGTVDVFLEGHIVGLGVGILERDGCTDGDIVDGITDGIRVLWYEGF